MITRFPSLGLRDPAFLQGVASWGIIGDSAPASLAANTFAWYKASAYESIAAGAVIGNLTLPLANRTNPALSNLVPLDAAAILGATATFEDYYVNLLYHSEDMSLQPWNFSNGSASNPTDLVFTAGGYIRQYCYRTFSPGETFTIRCKLKINAGTPNITFRVAGAGDGPSKPLGGVPSGVYQTFEATFTGGAASYVDIGINVDAACQISVTEFQIKRQADFPDYITTTTTPIERAYSRWKCFGASRQLNIYDGTSYGGWIPGANWTVAVPTLATYYMAGIFVNQSGGGYIWHTPGSFDPIIGYEVGGLLRMRMYRGAWVYGDAIPALTPVVMMFQFDAGVGAASMRLNKNAAVAVTSNTQSGLRMTFGSASAAYCDVCLHEFIGRNVKDNTATQDAIIEYLASWLGIVV
jgi:hypothetical protein